MLKKYDIIKTGDNVFDKYRGLLNLNDIFKNIYNYDNNSEIIDQSFVEAEFNGQREKFWFYFDNKKYLFKKRGNKSDDIYAEVIADEIAKTLEIDSANYTLGLFNNEDGVITESFIKENERLILGVEIMSEVLNKYGLNNIDFLKKYGIDNLGVKDAHNKLNNLEDIWSILDLYFIDNENKQELVKMTMDGLIKLLLFDMLTLQGDRHIRNWGIIANEKEETYRFFPLFDNSNICGLNRSNSKLAFSGMINSLKKSNSIEKNIKTSEQLQQLLYHSKLLFSVSDNDIINIERKKRKDNLDVLDYFISVSDSKSIELLDNYTNKLVNIGIENIISNKEQKMGINIDSDIKEHIINSINLNLNNICERLEVYKKGGNVL